MHDIQTIVALNKKAGSQGVMNPFAKPAPAPACEGDTDEEDACTDDIDDIATCSFKEGYEAGHKAGVKDALASLERHLAALLEQKS